MCDQLKKNTIQKVRILAPGERAINISGATCDADTTDETEASHRGATTRDANRTQGLSGQLCCCTPYVFYSFTGWRKSASKRFTGSFVADWPSTRHLFLPGTTRTIQTPSETKQNKLDAPTVTHTTHRWYTASLLCALQERTGRVVLDITAADKVGIRVPTHMLSLREGGLVSSSWVNFHPRLSQPRSARFPASVTTACSFSRPMAPPPPRPSRGAKKAASSRRFFAFA